MILSPLLWRPNWRDGVRERLAWRTAIVEAWDGSEQRQRLRTLPRQSWEYAITATDDRRRALVAASVAIASAETETLDLPLWTDISRLTAAAAADATVIYCDTAGRGFVAGAKVLIGDQSAGESPVLASVLSASSLQLTAGLASDWPAGTAVYPMRTARLVSAIEQRSLAPDVGEWRVILETDDLADPWEGAEGPDTYWDLPVWARRPNWEAGVRWRTERPLNLVDGEAGPRIWYGNGSSPDLTVTHDYTAVGRDALAELRRALYARAGQSVGAWMPSYQRDVRLHADADEDDETLTVSRAGWAGIAGNEEHRHLQIVLWDDTRLYVEITSATALTATTERLHLQDPLPQAITVAAVRRISWMYWARLAGDQIEIDYRAPDVARVQVAWRRPRLRLATELAPEVVGPQIGGIAAPLPEAIDCTAPGAPTGSLLYVMPDAYTMSGAVLGDEIEGDADLPVLHWSGIWLLAPTEYAASDSAMSLAPAVPTGTLS